MVQMRIEDQVSELRLTLAHVETDLSKEKERSRQLNKELTDIKNASHTKDSEIQTLRSQLLQTQVSPSVN